jgi:hypothetical protein
MMSAITLVASPIPSLVPSLAFAQQDGSALDLLGQLNLDSNNNQDNIAENEVDDNSVLVDPTKQTSVQTAVNINNDNDVSFSEGCAEINDNDQVIQVNELAADQVVHKNSDVGDGGVNVVDPTKQTSVQTAVNINNDNDVYIVLGCNDGNVKISDNDQVIQVNEQIGNQEALSDSEEGDGGVLVSQQTQRSAQTAINHNKDNDRVVYIESPILLESSSATQPTTLFSYLSKIIYMR